MRFTGIFAIAGLAALSLAACSGTDATRIVSVDANGNVAVVAYVDRNGDGVLSTGDTPLSGLRVRLTYASLPDSVASGATNTLGTLFLPGVPVGQYAVRVDSATLPDSLRVLAVDSAHFTLGSGDTVDVLVRAGYPNLSTREIRSTAAGTRVFAVGIALNQWNAFGDSTVAVADSAGAIRVVKLPPAPVAGGDSVRILGTVTSREGEPVLLGTNAFVLSNAETPPPIAVTTADAADARNNTLDADLVRISNAVVKDTTRTFVGDIVVTVDDGSGPVDMVLDHNAPIQVIYQSPLIGQKVNATGLLFPSGTGNWVLKPRTTSDLQFLGPPPPA